MTLKATALDGTYPRPRLVREAWTTLDGAWDFAFDETDAGLREHWFAEGAAAAFAMTITVPFPPESVASGIGDQGFHPVVWYRRRITAQRREGMRVILHFGAVDHEARVWVNGYQVAEHRGGQTAFSADITDALVPGTEQVVVVRAFDDPHDAEIPRGKQDWRKRPHDIWYERSTGIWRTVWVEEVPEQHIISFESSYDLSPTSIGLQVGLAKPLARGERVRVAVSLGEETLGSLEIASEASRVAGAIELPALLNQNERWRYLWSPEQPTLLDVSIEVIGHDGAVVDRVAAYAGLRTVAVEGGWFKLNALPYYVRSVLQQGYWPDSHFTAPSADAYRAEVEAILSLGFNAVRIHQKVEDPRFHYWADRLGLLVWGETAAAYAYTPRAAGALMSEWTEIVEQYRGHPSVVTWVPLNESWGVQDVARFKQQRDFVQSIASYTRALDPTRPVVSNDGWENVDSDIIAVHDYSTDPAVFAAHFSSAGAVRELLAGPGQAGRMLVLAGAQKSVEDGAPVMVTEFGGISYAADGTWGYAVVTNDEEYEQSVAALFAVLHASPTVVGFCYTQLTDTLQEANGLLRADRTPKLPIETLRAIVMGKR